ncbi:MAG: zinc ribbon domain-containing protein [Anaerolineae bacterium]|nr:zinc ribbon domain-containing protein [Anaerolineae bacterium]
MVHCAKCGTINADGRSFCSSCGSKLDRTAQRCPNCGALNQVGNIFCEKCQTKLVSPDAVTLPNESVEPSTPVKGISLPTRSNPDNPSSVPDWLQELTDNVQDEVFEEPSEDEDDISGLPDWLQELTDNVQDEVFEEPSEDEDSISGLPDWLTALAEPDDTAATGDELKADARDEALPDWLLDEDAERHPEPEEPSDSDVPDWLTGMPDVIQATPSESLDLKDVPDWLTDPAESEDEDATTTFEPVEATTESSRSEPAPTLNDSDLDSNISSELPEAGSEVGSEFGWVSELEESETESQILSGSFAITHTDEDIDIAPDWLSIPVSDTDLEETQGIQDATVSDSAEILPDAQGRAIEEQPVSPYDEAPDWLSTLDEFQPSSEEPPSIPQLSVEDLESGQNLPAWLSEIDVSQGTIEQASTVFTADDTATGEPSSPSWLDELPSPSDIMSIKPGAPAFVASGEGDVADQTLPDHEVDAAAQADIPSWVSELRFPESDETSEDVRHSTVDFAQADEAVGGSEDALIRAEIPGWLHNLKPPTDESWPPLGYPDIGAGEPGDGIAPVDVPDWVQELRPKPGAQQHKPSGSGFPPEPAELEGPLANLAGVLPSSDTVDLPPDYEVKLVALPESVHHQAQLWQQLIGRPRSAARVVKQTASQEILSPAFLRIITATILILVSLAALWLLPPGLLTTTSGYDPGTRAFVDDVDALQSGEPVVVAVEYNWAQAEEMTAIADAIAGHLRDQSLKVVAVSTMPEGASMITQLLEHNDLENQKSGGISYLPGSASGVAAFLQETETQAASMLIVITANVERLRWWLEQNEIAAIMSGKQPLPLYTGLSAAAGPLAAPYLHAENVDGWVIGFQDSVNYQSLRGLQNDEQVRKLDALMILHWIAITIIVIGFLFALIPGKKRGA